MTAAGTSQRLQDGLKELRLPTMRHTFLEVAQHARAEALSRASGPKRAGEVDAALDRLCSPARMGRLFKAMALAAPDGPVPAGFG